jgi:hypothetical protein
MTAARVSAAPRLLVGVPRRLWSWARRLPVARRDLALLVALGILARALTAALMQHPGYLDAAYYYAVARNVAAGRGLTEDFIITYLVPAPQVVHASNLWWMPGASLLLVPFFWVLGSGWWVAQLPNVLLTGTLPALGYLLGRELLGTRRAAVGAGLLTITSGFYYPLYGPMPDNFGLYGWAAGGALLLMTQGTRGHPRRFALAGLCCGVAHLARAEAPLLLLIASVVWVWARRKGRGALPMWSLAALVGLYLVVMAPWFARNLLLVGAPLPPGGLQSAWLRDYDDFFSYGLALTPGSYLAWGIGPILGSKLAVLGVTARELAAVMDFVLAPFALLGIWRLRRHLAALPWLLYTLVAFFALDLVFTFPALYGTVLHSEVAVFPYLNVATVAGLDAAVDWLGRHATGAEAARRAAERKRVYLGMAVALSALLSTFLVLANAHAWDATAAAYARAGHIIAADAAHAPAHQGRGASGAGQDVVVMVVDPANYYVDTGQRAIMVPDQGVPTMAAAARRYGARYLVLEPAHSPAQNALWSGTERTPLLTLLWSGPGLKIYRWNW